MIINQQKLEQVCVMIDRYPENLDMDTWTDGGTLVADKHTAPSCGTTGCVAGWVMALEHGAACKEDFYNDDSRLLFSFAEAAAEVLGLTLYQARKLFYLSYEEEDDDDGLRWPISFSKDYLNAKTPRERADATIARIKHFIATNGQE